MNFSPGSLFHCIYMFDEKIISVRQCARQVGVYWEVAAKFLSLPTPHFESWSVGFSTFASACMFVSSSICLGRLVQVHIYQAGRKLCSCRKKCRCHGGPSRLPKL